MRLLLVRHGQSEGNASGVVQGHVDFGLSELGWRQAEATATALAALRVDRVVSSPLRRALDTAKVIGAAARIEVEPISGLMEYDIGEASGLTGAEIRERFPEIMSAYRRGERLRFPGEEGRELFLQRVSAVLDGFRETDLSVVAVAHGGVVGALCYAALGLDYGRPGLFRVANCSITEFRRDRAGRVVIHRINDICHLGEHVTANDLG